MEYQQKLLLVFACIIVGVGIVAGIRKFQSASAEANQQALLIDLMEFAGKAQSYYLKPKELDGGNRSFAGLTEERLFGIVENGNGNFKIVPSENDQILILEAIGLFDGNSDGVNVTLRMIVYPDSIHSLLLSY